MHETTKFCLGKLATENTFDKFKLKTSVSQSLPHRLATLK